MRDPAALHRRVRELESALQFETLARERAEYKLKDLLRRLYDPKSDKIDPAQLSLLVSQVEADEALRDARPPVPSIPPKPETKRKGGGRRPMPAHLPIERIEIDLPEEQKAGLDFNRSRGRDRASRASAVWRIAGGNSPTLRVPVRRRPYPYCSTSAELLDIGRLYAIDKEADARGLTDRQRACLRHARARPILKDLQRRFAELQRSELPRSLLGEAARYAVNQWPALARYAKAAYGHVRIDNNPVERGIRPTNATGCSSATRRPVGAPRSSTRWSEPVT